MIYVVTATHNRKKITKKLVKCLNSQCYENWHLIVTDAGSTDETSLMLNGNIEETKLSLILGDENLWWTGGIQTAREFLINELKPKDDDVVLILNDDVEFDKDVFQDIENSVRKSSGTMILGIEYDKYTKKELKPGVKINWLKLKFSATKNHEEIDALPTRFLFMDYQTFFNAGDFSYKLFPHYASDYHWTINAKKKGFSLKVDEKIEYFCDVNTTGIKTNPEKNIISMLKSHFSKKNPINPIYLSVFFFINSPFGLKTINFLRVWILSIAKVSRLILLSFRKK